MNLDIGWIGWRGNMLNDHSGVQNRPKRRKINVRRVVKRVNTDLDEFMDDSI
jgi:hypothetical protein